MEDFTNITNNIICIADIWQLETESIHMLHMTHIIFSQRNIKVLFQDIKMYDQQNLS